MKGGARARVEWHRDWLRGILREAVADTVRAYPEPRERFCLAFGWVCREAGLTVEERNRLYDQLEGIHSCQEPTHSDP